MIRRIFLGLAFTTCVSFGFSQKMKVKVYMLNEKSSPSSDTIFYDFNRPLTWNDFNGKPDPNHSGEAVTSSGFAFDSEMNLEDETFELIIGVYSFFTKSDSWKKTKVNSDYHLLHEQLHFDITRIGAEKLLQELQEAPINKNNYQTLLNQIFEKVYAENSRLQNQYDMETKHSIDVNKQKEWDNKIALELKKIKQNTTVLK
ncbi:MAG: hypothetical protein ABIP35_10855 [Ginsengibacter sp.]